IAEVEETTTTNHAARHDLDLVEARAVEHENTLDAHVETHLADGERAAEPGAVLLDDHPLEDLDAVLVALDDLVVDADGVADAKLRMVRPELGCFESLYFRDGVHGCCSGIVLLDAAYGPPPGYGEGAHYARARNAVNART